MSSNDSRNRPNPPGPSNHSQVWVRNTARHFPIPSKDLEAIARYFLKRLRCSGEVSIQLVTARFMANINQRFLNHEGSTDVITFDHRDHSPPNSPIHPNHLHGEIFISPADARQFAEIFGTSWQEEVVRYILHGLLHLQGHTDLDPDSRRKMKRVENRLFKEWRVTSPNGANIPRGTNAGGIAPLDAQPPRQSPRRTRSEPSTTPTLTEPKPIATNTPARSWKKTHRASSSASVRSRKQA